MDAYQVRTYGDASLVTFLPSYNRRKIEKLISAPPCIEHPRVDL